ncbi:MAG: hypothetical protein HUU15_19975, partial [Candidatus Brocadiae bacterium]|nr:hypothetical protein [Candidatus Brocadiia bacterium]
MRTRLGRTIVAYLWIGTLALVCGIPAVLGALARLRSEARAESAAGPAPAADV